ALVDIDLREDDFLQPALLVGQDEQVHGGTRDIDLSELRGHFLAGCNFLDQQRRSLAVPHDLHVKSMDQAVLMKGWPRKHVLADVVLGVFLGVPAEVVSGRLDRGATAKQADLRLRLDLQDRLLGEDPDYELVDRRLAEPRAPGELFARYALPGDVGPDRLNDPLAIGVLNRHGWLRGSASILCPHHGGLGSFLLYFSRRGLSGLAKGKMR